VLVTEVARILDVPVCAFERGERGWMLAGQVRGGLRLGVSELQAALGNVSDQTPVAALDLRAAGVGLWTAVWLRSGEGPSAVLLLADDWTLHEDAIVSFAIAAGFALTCVRERQIRRRAEELLVDCYRLARRMSRLGGVETVCARIVEQVARSVGADRVAIALYRADDDRLHIAATHGYPRSVVQDVAIEPGAWVIGHVYREGRPVLVPDVRQLQGFLPSRREYGTFSFAAVPIFAGNRTLGVLSATDKRDGSPFTRQDIVILRTFCLSGALALMAAHRDMEVHRLAYAATMDAVTGLFNRPYLDMRLYQEVERAKRTGTAVSILMVDIDDFKRVNDTAGHPAGDAVLRAVGGILRSAVRVFDVCARYGGDEFAILMPSSDHESARACAERVRRRIADEGSGPAGHRMTVSIGIAVIESGDGAMELIRRADQCLYQAKADGKNRIRPILPKIRTPLPIDKSPIEPT
jgi:diguanylate cyclase (GGDEF)-like protein